MTVFELLGRVREGPLLPYLECGIQLYLQCDQDRERVAIGAATFQDDLTDDHPFNLYCGGKPLATACFLSELELAGVPCGPTVRLGELLGRDPECGPSLADLLGHRLRLGSPDLFQFLNTQREMRPGLLPSDLDLMNSSGSEEYSAIALPVALDGVLQRQTGRSLGTVVDEAARSLGMKSVFCRSASPPPIATYVDRVGDTQWPLLHDQLPSFHDSRWGHMTGLYGSASDIGGWLGALLLCEGRRPATPGLPSSDLFDQYLAGLGEPIPAHSGQFEAGFALLSSHGLQCPDDAIGHFGFVRSSLIYCSPRQKLVFVGVVRDLRLDSPESRLRTWQSVIDVLEGHY